MVRIFLFILVFIFPTTSSLLAKLRSFEGNINFVRETVFDTTYISISVKGEMVRVDEFDSQRKPIVSQIINLKEEEIVAISSDRKAYTRVSVQPRLVNATSSLDVIKSKNSKQINGHTCYQWRVKDKNRNTEIAYWVFEEGFDFYDSLLTLLKRTEYSFSVFSDLPETEGFFPMLTEERTLLRKDKLRVAVVDIKETNLKDNLFEIPKGYQSMRR